MLVGAFDASGSEDDQPVLVVAGFVSTYKDWTEFDAEWRERLAADGLSYFHMVDFAQSRKEFSGWKGDEPRRRRLLVDLMGIITKYAYAKFGSVVVNQTLAIGVSSKLREEFYLDAYPLAGRGAAAQVREWTKSWKGNKRFRLVFEDGDLGKGKLRVRLIEDAFTEPIFKAKKEFTPLQAADFLAYELFLAARNAELRPGARLRWAIEGFDKMPGEPGIFLPEDLKRLEGGLKLSKEINRWAKGLENRPPASPSAPQIP